MTPTDITVTGEDFVSVNEETGFPVGTALELQTKCASAVIVQRKEGKPSATDDNGRVMKSVKNASSIYKVREGSEEVWLRLNTDNFESGGRVGVYPVVEDINYVARLDGEGKYWQLSGSGIDTLSGDVLEIDFIGGELNGNASRIIGAESFAYSCDTGTDASSIRLTRMTGTLDDVEIVSLVTPIPLSGTHTLSLTTLSDGSLRALGGLLAGDRLINTALSNFRVHRGGVVIHEIPLTNKSQGATQLPTVGNVSATMIGYTGDEWEEV